MYKTYDTAYPLYISEKLENEFNKSADFSKLDKLEGFIALGMCRYTLVGRVFRAMLLFNTAENREKAGLILEGRGVDMREVAVSRPVKLKNPMPLFSDYRNSPTFRQDLHKKLKLYNDKIFLDYDDLAKICESVANALSKNQLSLHGLYNLDELPLPNVSLIIGSKTFNFAVNRQEKTIMMEKYLYNDKLVRVVIEPQIVSDHEVKNQVKVIYQAPTILMDDKKYSDNIDMFLAVNYFIKNIPSSYQVSTKKVASTIETGKGHNKRYKEVIHLEKSYTFENLKKMSRTHLKHVFSCLCWGVRGHYRHMKSGKVIFIQPFKKGKERNNMSALREKEYQL